MYKSWCHFQNNHQNGKINRVLRKERKRAKKKKKKITPKRDSLF